MLVQLLQKSLRLLRVRGRQVAPLAARPSVAVVAPPRLQPRPKRPQSARGDLACISGKFQMYVPGHIYDPAMWPEPKLWCIFGRQFVVSSAQAQGCVWAACMQRLFTLQMSAELSL